MYDNYPEVLIAAGKTGPNSLISNIIAFLNRWLMKHAHSIIVIGRDMKQLLQKKTQGLDVPIRMIPNCADVDSILPASKSDNPLLRELDIDDKFVFLYAGNIGRTHDIETIVECAERLTSNDRIHFLFLGNGGKRKWLRNEVEGRALKNVSVLDPLPSDRKQTFMNACDVAIISLVPGMNGVSVPSRTYNTMAAGKPILAITEGGSELDLIVNEERIGWISPPRNADELVRNVEYIAKVEPRCLDEMSTRARRAAESKYTFEHAIRKYEDALR
jgi:glycosyltransferase involved in cell wall biosynthesis